MRKNIENQKNYFKLADNYRNNEQDLMTIGEIYTMSAIKSLLGKKYTPYIDSLRRTYGRNKSAQKIAELWELVAEVEQERKPHQAEKRKTQKKLENIKTPTAELDELNELLDDIQQNLDRYSDELKELKRVATAGENLTSLEDCFQVFRLYYMDYTPKASDYTGRLNQLLGLDREPLNPTDYEPATPLENRKDTDTDGTENRKPPTKRQLENRQQWAELNGRQKRGTLEHLARIKNGQRAVNRWLRTQGNKTADYGGNTISLTTAKDNGEKITAWTNNTLIEELESHYRIKALLAVANLTPQESKAVNLRFSKEAQQAGIKARADYHDKYYKTMVEEQHHVTDFRKGRAKAHYDGQVDFAYNTIGIYNPSRKSQIEKSIREKLRPKYEEMLRASREHDSRIKLYTRLFDQLEQKNRKPRLIIKNGKVYRKKVRKSAGDLPTQQSKLVIVPAPHREPQTVAWLTKEQAEQNRQRIEFEFANRWSIAEPTAESGLLHCLLYARQQIAEQLEQEQLGHPTRPAEHISGLTDQQRAKHKKSMADRTARAEKLDSWNYKPPAPKPAPAEPKRKRRTKKQLEQLANQQRTATAKSWSIEKHWQSIRAREEEKGE